MCKIITLYQKINGMVVLCPTKNRLSPSSYYLYLLRAVSLAR